MPQLHVALIVATLEKDSKNQWQVVLKPNTDPHWEPLPPVGTDYRLEPEEFGHYVEMRLPAAIVHDNARLSLRARSEGGLNFTWQQVGESLVSPPLPSGAKFYLDVDATPVVGSPLPIGLPPTARPRGGGHYHVKDRGGGGGRLIGGQGGGGSES